MPSFPISLRKSSKEKSTSPEGTPPKPKPRRASTALTDVFGRETTSSPPLSKLPRNNSTTSLSSTTGSKSRIMQSGKQLFTRSPTSKPSLLNVKRSTSPTSSVDDTTATAPATLPSRKNSFRSRIPFYKGDDSGTKKASKTSLERSADAASLATRERSSSPAESLVAVQPSEEEQVVASPPPPPPPTQASLAPPSDVTASIETLNDSSIVEDTPVIVSTPETIPQSLDADTAIQSDHPSSLTILPSSSEQEVIIPTPAPEVGITSEVASDPTPAPEPLSPLIIVPPPSQRLSELERTIISPIQEEPAEELPSAVDLKENKKEEIGDVPQPDSARSSLTIVQPLHEPVSKSKPTALPLHTPPGSFDKVQLPLSNVRDVEVGSDSSTLKTSSTFFEEPTTLHPSAFYSHIASLSQTRDDRRIPNIVFFGDTGSGKSSVINMLMNSDVVGISNSAEGMTLGGQSYIASIDGFRVRLWDTSGLDEVEGGTVPARLAMRNIRDLIGALKDGVSLLVYCIRATRFRPNIKVNYELIRSTICQAQVPVLLVVTGLENERRREVWWDENADQFDLYRMAFEGHACITATRGKRMQSGGYLYEREYLESRQDVKAMIKEFFLAERPSWVIEDKEAWASRTSARMDHLYEGRGQTGWEEAFESGCTSSRSWWAYFASYFSYWL